MKNGRNSIISVLLSALFFVFILSACGERDGNEGEAVHTHATGSSTIAQAVTEDTVQPQEDTAQSQEDAAQSQEDAEYTEGVITEPTASEIPRESTLAEDTLAPVHTHEYSAVSVPPTCTEDGYTEYACACGDTHRDDYVQSNGHEYQITDTSKSSCTVQGKTVYKCIACGDSYEEYTEPSPHVLIDSVTPATCTENGYTTHKCKNCQYSYTDSVTESTGHSSSRTV